MPTGIDEKLLPEAVSSRVIESAIRQSVVLQLATTQPMPAFVEQIPVVTTAPSANWVASGGRKPLTEVAWSAETLKAEECAAVTSIPDAYIADTSGSWDVEESVETELTKAIVRALDAAVLFGVNAPSS
jgi:HK97 family phage major capsid protein